MNHQPLQIGAALLALFVSGLTTQPAVAAAQDEKSISPMVCQARGPGTTISELTIGPFGITNPGSTSESVICPIPGDSDDGWSPVPGTSAHMLVYYRIGAVPGNVACTVFTSTAAVTPAATYSVSYTTPVQAAGTRDKFILALAESGNAYGAAPPTVLVCTLSPQAALGWIYFQEHLATDTP